MTNRFYDVELNTFPLWTNMAVVFPNFYKTDRVCVRKFMQTAKIEMGL